ncbi:YceI family protein [Lutimonas saemankumensis]|uniref:YceI family protein n=1 Tax=Lutimonas saemankumensis TaxID=483016 RepID=UPI001CD74FEE|nr:YceI family protein [Lutimonas saemankumensis]MCA0931095.1 YceI family protein [Lutimonas saemankumensis]
MKNFIKKSVYATFLLFTMVVVAQEQYEAATASSKVNWKGSKPTGEHYGKVALKDGHFKVANGMIVGGEFNIDMNSIVVEDLPQDDKYNAKLVNHLKSDDFFGAATYPLAHFNVTSTEKKGDQTLIKGDLKIKEKTHSISFLADVSVSDKNLYLKTETFTIDRSKWDIKYKSQSFFSDLGDKFISDDIELSVVVEANK